MIGCQWRSCRGPCLPACALLTPRPVQPALLGSALHRPLGSRLVPSARVASGHGSDCLPDGEEAKLWAPPHHRPQRGWVEEVCGWRGLGGCAARAGGSAVQQCSIQHSTLSIQHIPASPSLTCCRCAAAWPRTPAVIVNWKSELTQWLPTTRCVYYVGNKASSPRPLPLDPCPASPQPAPCPPTHPSNPCCTQHLQTPPPAHNPCTQPSLTTAATAACLQDERARKYSQEVQSLQFNVLVTTYEFIMRDRARLSKVGALCMLCCVRCVGWA